MEGQRKPGERGFSLASLNLDAEPAPKNVPEKKGDYSFATSLMQKVAAGSPKPKIGKGAELKWDGTKFVLHVDGKQAPIKEPIEEITPPTPQAPTGRDAEPPTKNPNNIDQKGTIMGRSSLSIKDAQPYVGKDVQIANPFLSNALPGTNDDGYSYVDAVAMGANPAEAAIKTGGGEVQVTFDGGEQIETKMVQGSPNLVLSGSESAAPTGEKTNDIKDPSTWDENYARRRAFLDADSSMAGLKAVQAQKGIVKAGNTYYMNTGKTDDKGNPLLEAIEGKDAKQDVRGYMRGAQGAQDLKNKYIDKIQASEQSLTSPAPENYTSTEQSPITSIDSTAQVDAAQITDAPTLIDEVNPAFTDKDKTGRYNLFR